MVLRIVLRPVMWAGGFFSFAVMLVSLSFSLVKPVGWLPVDINGILSVCGGLLAMGVIGYGVVAANLFGVTAEITEHMRLEKAYAYSAALLVYGVIGTFFAVALNSYLLYGSLTLAAQGLEISPTAALLNLVLSVLFCVIALRDIYGTLRRTRTSLAEKFMKSSD